MLFALGLLWGVGLGELVDELLEVDGIVWGGLWCWLIGLLWCLARWALGGVSEGDFSYDEDFWDCWRGAAGVGERVEDAVVGAGDGEASDGGDGAEDAEGLLSS